MSLKAIFLNASLKRRQELSNTQVLCEFLGKQLKRYGVQSEYIRLSQYNIRPGVYTNVPKDDWVRIYRKILTADILIFATPIWWDVHSSLLQRIIERLDEVHDDFMNTGKSVLANKVAGVVITGDSDGAMHIIGSVAMLCMWLGLTMAPLGSLSVLGPELAKGSKITKAKLWKLYEREYTPLARATAQNLSYMAKLLRQHPYPELLLPWKD